MYNAEEIYTIGVEIEKNGKRYYDRTAAAADDPDVAKLLKELSSWEDSHVALFEQLATQLPENAKSGETIDPDEDMQRYLKAVADSHVFLQKDIDIDAVAQGCKTAVDVLEMALRFEKDSVVLYTTMQHMVPEHLGKRTIGRLAQEEIAHVSLIQSKLTVLKGSE
ncbi:MAG: hypothetical protein GF331_02355 [Chitinivibrionales bacterium]|nr:hypothetical protein [Chitinivibrionales bacterium]